MHVALSRTTSPDRVFVLIPEGGNIAKNIVFAEALNY